jgi:hypothetical protein
VVVLSTSRQIAPNDSILCKRSIGDKATFLTSDTPHAVIKS